MLDEFIITHRDAIVAAAQAQLESATGMKASPLELNNGIPVFLEQLGGALRFAKTSSQIAHEQIRTSAGQHGRALLMMGLSVGQVVRDYGSVCQVITTLAVSEGAPIEVDEFRTLNLCLDDAIAAAVTEFSRQREHTIAEQSAQRERDITDHGSERERAIEDEGTERLGVLAHEMRNLLTTAMLSFENIRTGRVAVGGSTGLVHARSLIGLRDLIDRSLADVRLDAGINRTELIPVAQFVEEIEIGAMMQARASGVTLVVTAVEPALMILGDRQILAAAVSNLLQNAFKFTHKGGTISLATEATGERVLFEVQDECGGLPDGAVDDLFTPFQQRGANRSGVGLGLSICRRAAQANGGEIRVRDLPGEGCVFTLDLPRHPPPPLRVLDGGKGTAGVAEGSTVPVDSAGAGSPKARTTASR